MKENDHVLIRKKGIRGTIIDITRDDNGAPVYLVENDLCGPVDDPDAIASDYARFECAEDQLEVIDPLDWDQVWETLPFHRGDYVRCKEEGYVGTVDYARLWTDNTVRYFVELDAPRGAPDDTAVIDYTECIVRTGDQLEKIDE